MCGPQQRCLSNSSPSYLTLSCIAMVSHGVMIGMSGESWLGMKLLCWHSFWNTVQEEILAREIFGEIARLKHLANFTLTNDIWMY